VGKQNAWAHRSWNRLRPREFIINSADLDKLRGKTFEALFCIRARVYSRRKLRKISAGL
jgi:hypothetical protein